MTVEELIKELKKIPDKSVKVKMYIGAAGVEGIPETEVINVDWVVPGEGNSFVLLDDYPR